MEEPKPVDESNKPKVEEPKPQETNAKDTNSVVQVSKLDESDSKEGTQPQNTFVVDTERSVGFTGVDSVFGESGDAELRPMIDEEDGEIKILGESEALDLDDIEDLNGPHSGFSSSKDGPPAPLSSDDYEAL